MSIFFFVAIFWVLCTSGHLWWPFDLVAANTHPFGWSPSVKTEALQWPLMYPSAWFVKGSAVVDINLRFVWFGKKKKKRKCEFKKKTLKKTAYVWTSIKEIIRGLIVLNSNKKQQLSLKLMKICIFKVWVCVQTVIKLKKKCIEHHKVRQFLEDTIMCVCACLRACALRCSWCVLVSLRDFDLIY